MARLAGFCSQFLLTILAVMSATWAVVLHPGRAVALGPREGPAISEARSWGYQLQNVRPGSIPADIDVMVVDFARGGKREMSRAEVAALARRPDGTSRIVLAYMSIGEAENYRWYWQSDWALRPPAWLGPENPNWKGNFAVRFWDPAWQRIIVDPTRDADGAISLADKARMLMGVGSKSYVDRIVEAGFDGVYLDRVDAYDTALDRRATARADMIGFVAAISRHAKSRKTGFLIVPQNGEELLSDARYREHIDALAKEDLVYGLAGDEQPNGNDDVTASVRLLDRLKAAGKPVFVVEYLADPTLRVATRQRIARLGYVPTFTGRELNAPPEEPALHSGRPASEGASGAPARPESN